MLFLRLPLSLSLSTFSTTEQTRKTSSALNDDVTRRFHLTRLSEVVHEEVCFDERKRGRIGGGTRRKKVKQIPILAIAPGRPLSPVESRITGRSDPAICQGESESSPPKDHAGERGRTRVLAKCEINKRARFASHRFVSSGILPHVIISYHTFITLHTRARIAVTVFPCFDVFYKLGTRRNIDCVCVHCRVSSVARGTFSRLCRHCR